MNNLGIAAERYSGSISFFDTETLSLLYKLNTEGSDPLDVAVTPNGSNAIITTAYSQTINKVNLHPWPPVIANFLPTLGLQEDVDITPDSRFAVIVDGSNNPNPIYSYNIYNNTIQSQIPTNAQAVAVSPNGSGLVLTAKNSSNSIRIFKIDSNGNLTDTNTEISNIPSPINITFTSDGNFAFIASGSSTTISILNTSNINNITLVGSALSTTYSQTIVISKDCKKVYVLCANSVDVFNFTTTPSPTLTFSFNFTHSLSIISYYGIEQMALNNNEDKLFISASNLLSVFTVNGTSLGIIPGINANGGVAISPGDKRNLTRGLLLF